MNKGETKLDADVKLALDKLANMAEMDVLVYPIQITETFKQFLQNKQDEGILEYNILHLANCAFVKAPKKVILEIAARDDISQIRMNPRVTLSW